jgi:lysophospholipase L1-like esterase
MTAVLAAILAAGSPAFGAADRLDGCPASRVAPLALPRVKEALAGNSEVTIVAFGSSSTAGWHASSIAQSYPAVLQAELSAALPYAHVAIINRGVGGQDAAEMLPRIDADVLAVRPSLVIWQVGANGAIKDRDPEGYRKLIIDGVQTLKAAGIDVVLMDNQRAPIILAAPHHLEIDQATADVATYTGVGFFDRGALMDQWRLGGYPYKQFISDDGVHHNDAGYRCVASALASAILDGLGKPTTLARSTLAHR